MRSMKLVKSPAGLVGSGHVAKLATLAMAFGLLPASPATAQSAQPNYDRIFPVYAEFCAVSKIKSLDESVGGGKYGHSALFLKGACRDTDASYPRLKSCAGGEVGVSVNSYFNNVNWIAVDDKAFFFHGGIPYSETVTKEKTREVIATAVKRGYLKNVKILKSVMSEMDPKDNADLFIARQSLGTDFGLTLARTVRCVRIPVTRPMMDRIVDYYNSLNEYYFVGGHEYKWNDIGNNCAHVAYNALAAAGAWQPKNTKDALILTVIPSFPIPIKLSNAAIPFNVLIDAVAASNDGRLPTLEELKADPIASKTLVEQGWLLNQPGALVEKFVVHEKNEVYDTNPVIRLIDIFPFPLVENPGETLTRQFSDPRYSDLRTNLKSFREKIVQAQKQLKYKDRYQYEREMNAAFYSGNPSMSDLFNKYEAYLAKQLKFVNVQLAALGEK